jgi:hypothetical protein
MQDFLHVCFNIHSSLSIDRRMEGGAGLAPRGAHDVAFRHEPTRPWSSNGPEIESMAVTLFVNYGDL